MRRSLAHIDKKRAGAEAARLRRRTATARAATSRSRRTSTAARRADGRTVRLTDHTAYVTRHRIASPKVALTVDAMTVCQQCYVPCLQTSEANYMSRYIATRAIRGANLLVNEADADAPPGARRKRAGQAGRFPNTAYYLPTILGMTGREVTKLGDLTPVRGACQETCSIPCRPTSCWHALPGRDARQRHGHAAGRRGHRGRALRQRRGARAHPGFHMAGGSFTSPDWRRSGCEPATAATAT